MRLNTTTSQKKITIYILDKDPFWKITVTDYGTGIPDNKKQLIFERFYRTKNNNLHGSGLGLAIVKKIVELHGGDVGVSDNPEIKGSQFWITLKKSFL
ncbi:MAG: ATP-binding protein [Methanohalobium sp.]|uniref:ATP-binding protein n=1 Tax=Methanohalobium sp. TaxID=2837493 RepID=UPI00397AEA5E